MTPANVLAAEGRKIWPTTRWTKLPKLRSAWSRDGKRVQLQLTVDAPSPALFSVSRPLNRYLKRQNDKGTLTRQRNGELRYV